MNVIPYFWYDFNEKKQKSVIRVLKIRSMFEDYGNGVLNDGDLVEAVDIIRTSREMHDKTSKAVNKKAWKAVKDKAERKAAKKAYLADVDYNNEIEIAKFVCEELDKFSGEEFKFRVEKSREIYGMGLDGIRSADKVYLKAELNSAKAMDAEKAVRKAAVEIVKSIISASKYAKKYYPEGTDFVQPVFAKLEEKYAQIDKIEAEIKALNESVRVLKKSGDAQKLAETKARVKALSSEVKALNAEAKSMSNEFAKFNRAAKPYLDAKKLLTQAENYTHYDEISEKYDIAKVRHEEAVRVAAEEKAAKEAAEKAHAAELRAQRKNKKK